MCYIRHNERNEVLVSPSDFSIRACLGPASLSYYTSRVSSGNDHTPYGGRALCEITRVLVALLELTGRRSVFSTLLRWGPY